MSLKKHISFSRNKFFLVLYAGLAAFGTYFCMYAFRKPFTVATFEGIYYFGIDYKILLIIAQIIGYASSKFFGIKVISELSANNRWKYLIGFVLIAEAALLLFGIVPKPYHIILMFLNGLPLGMIWGIVFSYLEGRKYTEIMGVILCTSFIVSSGVVKSVGLFVMNIWGISQYWMPSITGALFIVPLLIFSLLLKKIPQPSEEDILLRSERLPMNAKDRKQLVLKYLFPITILILFYTFLTAFRSFRDNFAREIWDAVGYKGSIAVYTTSETIIAVVVLLILGLLFVIKNNFKALQVYHYILIVGVILLGANTFLFQKNIINPYYWMVISGFSLYICYVPFNCLFFDRMIATFHLRANSGFLIYLADAFGYLGSVIVLLYKSFGQNNTSWVQFFIYGSYGISLVGFIAILLSLFYFRKQYKQSSKHNIIAYENQI